MQRAGIITLGMVSAAMLASVTLAAPRTELENAAKQLEEQARIVASHSDTVAPVYRDDAHELAQRAVEFRSLVGTASVSDADVSAQFRLVARSYQRFREQVEHANTQQSQADLAAVTAPYEAVERELGIHPGAETGARG